MDYLDMGCSSSSMKALGGCLMRRVPESIVRLCSGSLESVRAKFVESFGAEEIVATFPGYVISRNGTDYLRRDLRADGWGEASCLWSSLGGDGVLEAKAVVNRIVSDSFNGGSADVADINVLVDYILAGHVPSVSAMRESIVGLVGSNTAWRDFFRNYEPRIRKVLHGELSRIESGLPRPKYREVRLGGLDDAGVQAAVQSVKLSLAELGGLLGKFRERVGAVSIPVAPVGRMDLEQDLLKLRAVKSSLESELTRVLEYLVGLEADALTLEDCALTYDLLADEAVRYGVMVSFLERTASVVSTSGTVPNQ